MRQQINKGLSSGVLALAVFAIGGMIVIASRGAATQQPGVHSSAATSTPTISAAPTPTPAPAPARKLSRAETAAQKKAAAIAASDAAHADALARKADADAVRALLVGLFVLMLPALLFAAWRVQVARRRYWARVQGEGFEQGRMRARERAASV